MCSPVFAQTVVVPQRTVNPGVPIRLTIPQIKVHAVLDQIGLTGDGILGVPNRLTHAGWFSLGVMPGEIGTAIIDGHYGWKKGTPAVFNHLSELVKGDRISVQDARGRKIFFVVRELKRFDPNADADAVFQSADEASHLNLITCEGIWNPVTRQYSKRLVVFADKE